MCDKELLVGYLYDELPPAERSKFEAHMFTCSECRDEVSELRGARMHLASWAPPQPDFGFQIIRNAHTATGAGRRFRISPAWGFAAAAALVLAVASAIANLDVTVGRDGLAIRTGWGRTQTAPVAAVAGESTQTAATPAADDAWRAELRRVDTRLRELETATAARLASPASQMDATNRPGPRMTDADRVELLRQVRNIVAQSETRQQRELALQIAQVIKDFDSQRRTDLVRIQQGLGRLEAYTGAEVAQQREMLNRIVRVSQGR